MRKTKFLKIVTLGVSASLMLMLFGCGEKKEASEDTNANIVEEKTETDETTEDAAEDVTEDTEATQETAGIFENMNTVDLNGEAVDSSIFVDNTLTLVNVWNRGCTPCIMEIPELDKLNKDYEEKGVAVKGLIYEFGVGIEDDARAEVEEILGNAGAEYQQLLVSEEMLPAAELQELEAFPTTYLVNSEGKIIGTVLGSRDYDGWKEVVEGVLQEIGNE